MMKKNAWISTGLLCLSWIAAALLVGFRGDFPLNDDWQYAYPVQQLVEQGQLKMMGYFSPNILLQVYWGALFCELPGGFSFEHLRISTWVAAGLGGLAVYQILRSLGKPQALALLGTPAVLFSPMYFHLSFSFMTDVPFLAVVLWAAWAALRFQQQRSGGWLALFAGLSILAYLNRQPGVLLLPALAGWYVLDQRARLHSWVWLLISLLAAAGIYLGYERLAKPALGIADNFLPVSDQLLGELLADPLHNLSEMARRALKSWVYLGFFSLPLIPFLLDPIRRTGILRTRPLLVVLLANGVLLAAQYAVGKNFPYGGNILYNWGLGPELLADVYTLGLSRNTPQYPLPLMVGTGYLSQLSATVLSVLAWQRWRVLQPSHRAFFTFLLLLNAGNFLVMSVTAFFDRYILLSVLSALLFFTTFVEKPKPLRRYLLLLVFGLFSLLATRDYLAWNRARAQAYEWLQEKGVGIRQMDAGYEYNGWYNYQRERQEVPGQSWWWVNDDRWMIAFGPVPGYRELQRFPFRRWLWAGQQDDIFVLERQER